MRPRHSGFAVAAAFLAAVLASPADAGDEHVVTIRDYRFEPALLQIKAGDSVRWVNAEKRTSHSVLFTGSESLESERLFPGEGWVRQFEAGGSHPYRCGPHPEMTGEVRVLPAGQ